MILYVNGDSHTAAAEAVNPYAFAEDDPSLVYMGRVPHPANLAVSWGRLLADAAKATLRCDAESASSNDRIMRTIRAWLAATGYPPSEILMIIQWSTWERAEWLIEGTWYQINASGTDHVPESHQAQYQEFIAAVDWEHASQEWHDRIWTLHEELTQRNIRHIFFNGNTALERVPKKERKDWGAAYIAPYDPAQTWDQWLKSHGHDTVAPDSWHFGRSAHAAWSRFMLQYAIRNKLLT